MNESKTKTMITVLKESDDLKILGGTLDTKMNIEKHLCAVSRAEAWYNEKVLVNIP